MEDFDKHVTCQLEGFSLEDYYQKHSSKHFLESAGIPLLLINAMYANILLLFFFLLLLLSL